MNDEEEACLDDSGSEQGDSVAMLWEDSDSDSEQGDFVALLCEDSDAESEQGEDVATLCDDLDDDLSGDECRTEPVGLGDQKKGRRPKRF